jgi:hypothetical protein
MSLQEILPVLQFAIGPVIVISGVGLILLSMTNRYGRVIDRSRVLADARRAGDPETVERCAKQLGVLLKRGRLLRMCIILASTSLLLASLLIIALFITALLRVEDATVVVALFIACMGTLVASLSVFIYDINVSLKAVKLEVGSPLEEVPGDL